AGNAPDICELGTTWISKFASSGVLVDITDDIKEIKEKYFLWDAATYNNRIYGIPWLAGTRVLFYNKDLFLSAGLNPDTPPHTWHDLLGAVKKIHSPEKGVWGFSIFTAEPESPWQEFLPFTWSLGGRLFNDDFTQCLLNSKETEEALNFYKALSKYSLIERQSQVNELFAEGKVGVQISGSWNLRLIPRVNPQLNFGVGLMPKPQKENSSSVAFAGGELFVITKSSKHKREALELIKFLTNKENVMEIVNAQQNVVPAQKEALQEPYYEQYPEQKIFLLQRQNALSPPNHPRWTEIQEIITQLIEETIMKDINPKEAIQNASFKIDRILKEDIKKGGLSDKLIAMIAGIIFLAGILFICIISIIKYKVKKCNYRRLSIDKDTKPFLYLSPWFLIFLVFGLYPLLYSLIISFSKYDLLTSRFNLIGMKNYLLALSDKEFHRALWHTLVFCIGTVPFTVGIALFCAVLINRKIPFKQFYQAGLFLPVTTSVVVIATIFTYIYSPNGLANLILDYFGIIHPQSSWLNSPLSWCDISIPLLSIMAMNIWASFGYYTVLFLAGLQTIPDKLYEMASLDGATEWHKFKYITFPQLKPIMLLVIVINTIYSLQVFPEIFTMTMGGPLGSTTTAVYHLYNIGFHKFDMGMASSVAYLLSIIIMLFSLVQIRLLKTEEKLEE
ncbi:MAG: extracellular solute-binding protein, partial [Candidatus Omnitrophica bacterium]|nr:extracellular solute-binding protein [Candidatus Omnitrophota bacterium]